MYLTQQSREAAPPYTSQERLAANKRQARTIWAVGSSIVAIWVLAIILPTLLSPVRTFFGYLCHQISERSFHVAGEQMAVCSRCFGVYLGILVGFALYPLFRNVENTEPPRRFWLLVAIIPAAVDWSLTVFGVWENTLWSRLVTGLILGGACSVFIVPAVVEIVRNLTRERQANFR